MVLRSIKKLRSPSVISKSPKKSTSNAVDAVIETIFTGTSGQEVTLSDSSGRDNAPSHEVEGTSERDRSNDREETDECAVDTESREEVYNGSSIKDEERDVIESKSIRLHLNRTKPAEMSETGAIKSPRFHPNWTKDAARLPQPSIEVSETEIEVVTMVQHKKEKVPKFRSFMKLGKSKREVGQQETLMELEQMDVEKDATKEDGEISELAIKASVGDAFEFEEQMDIGTKSGKIQRMGSLKIAVLDNRIVPDCSQSVSSGIKVPLTKSPSMKSDKSSAKAAESEGLEAETAVKKEAAKPEETQAPSVFADIGSMFQRMSRQMSSLTASIGNSAISAANESTLATKEGVQAADGVSIQSNLSNVASPQVDVNKEVKSTVENPVIDHPKVALNRSTSVDRVQSLAKSIANALEVAIEGASINKSVCIGEKPASEKTEDGAVEVSLEGISADNNLVYHQNGDASVEAVQSLADGTWASVKSITDTIFSALEVAIEGTTSAGLATVFKQQEENADVPKTAAEESTSVVPCASAIEETKSDSSVQKPKSVAVDGSVKVDAEITPVNESPASDAHSIPESSHVSIATKAKSMVSIKGAFSTAKSPVSPKSAAKVASVKDVLSSGAQSVATSIHGGVINKETPQTSMELHTSEQTEIELVEETNAKSTDDEDKEEPQLIEETGADEETMGKALLDSVLYNLAKAEMAAISDGNTEKQVKIHLLRSKILRITNRKDKWADQLEGNGEPDQLFISGPMRRFMTPLIESIGYAADMIDRAILNGNAACMIGAADLFDRQCLDHTQSPDTFNEQKSNESIVGQSSC